MHVNFMCILSNIISLLLQLQGLMIHTLFQIVFLTSLYCLLSNFRKRLFSRLWLITCFYCILLLFGRALFFNTSTLYLFCCCYFISFRFKFTWLLVKQYDQYKTLNPANERGNIILEMTSIRFASDCTRVDKEVQTVWTAPTFPLPLGS